MATVIRKPRSDFWYARYRHNGRDVTRSTEKTNRREAEAVLKKWLAEENGDVGAEEAFRLALTAVRRLEKQATDDPARLDEVRRLRRRWAAEILHDATEPLGLESVWDAWLHSPAKRTPGPATLSGYGSIWSRFKEWLEKRREPVKHLHEATVVVAMDYAEDLSKRGCSGRTFNAHVKFLRSLCKTLKMKAGLFENPFDHIATVEQQSAVRRELTPDELKKIIRISRGEDRLMIEIGIFTGLRLGDIARLRWDSVNLHTGIMSVTPSKTARKGRKVSVPIHPALKADLKTWQASGQSGPELVFPTAAAIYEKDRAALAMRFTEIFKAAKIKTTAKMEGRKRSAVVVGFHSLRHSFVSLCAASGVPQHVVQAMVGHGSPAMTEHYTHVDAKQKRSAIAALPSLNLLQSGEAA